MRPMKLLPVLFFILFTACNPNNQKESETVMYNVCDFGAVGDGVTTNTEAINRAIDSCHTAGGGMVYFPEGIFITGSIRLKSNVELHVSQGATIQGAENGIGAYDVYEENEWDKYQDFGHSHFRNALIWAENEENISITGHGNIHGGGLSDRNYLPPGDGDKMISLKSCKNIMIRNLRLEQGGHFAIITTGCDSLNITNLKIFTPRDGIDIVSCHDVVINQCFIECVIWKEGLVWEGDDAIGLKSDYALGYPRDCKNILIEDCVIFSAGANAFTIGSETVGNFSNIILRNISIQGAEKAGIGITTNDGGIIDGMLCSNITMSKCATPVFINITESLRRPGGGIPGRIKNITFENIRVSDVDNYVRRRSPYGPWASTISGIKGDEYLIENVSFRNVSIIYKGSGEFDWRKISPPDPSPPRASPRHLGQRPSYGFYIRHVKNISFDNVKMDLERIDNRPGIYAYNVDGLVLKNFSFPGKFKSEKDVVLKETQNFKVFDKETISCLQFEE